MRYNYKEYETILDTPDKRIQERAIVTKIMEILNNNRFDGDLERFIENNKTYQDCLKNNNLSNVVKHFGNTLKEEHYIMILDNLRKLTKKKQSFEDDKIKTINFDNNELNSYSGKNKNFYFDNTGANKDLKAQMNDLQKTSDSFQASDAQKNTENMMNELEKNTKRTLNFQYLKDIIFSSLSYEEQQLYLIAKDYESNIDGLIRIDLNKGVFIDKDEKMYKITENNGEFKIIGEDTNEDISENQVTKTEEKGYQKKLMPNTNTIYSN